VADEVWPCSSENQAYGDAALSPVRVFSRAPVVEQLLVRIDDKLAPRAAAAGEDVAAQADARNHGDAVSAQATAAR
jgi:hypothetical protein